MIVGIAVSGDLRVKNKINEKIEMYGDLCRELERLSEVRCSVVPAVVGALGTIPTRLAFYMTMPLDISISVETVRKPVILGMAWEQRTVLKTVSTSSVPRCET